MTTVWELKLRQRIWHCAFCDAEVYSVQYMRGRFVVCQEHRKWHFRIGISWRRWLNNLR